MIDDPGSIQRMRSIAAHCLLWMNDSHRVHETKDSVAVDQNIHWEEIGDPEAVRVLYALVDHGQAELQTDKDRDERAAQMRGRRIIGATVIGVCIASLATIVLKSEHNAPQPLPTRASLGGTNSPRGATFARVGIPGGDRQDYDVNHSIASMALVAGMMPIAASVAQAQCSTDGYAWPSGSFGFANGQHCSELAAGRDFVVAVREDGTLQKFGNIAIHRVVRSLLFLQDLGTRSRSDQMDAWLHEDPTSMDKRLFQPICQWLRLLLRATPVVRLLT
jgi:hypothetical protein